MASEGRAAEVPDSEDELFTSSPEAPVDDAVGQFDGITEEPPQDASSRGRGSLGQSEDTDASHIAEHATTLPDDKHQVGLHPCESVAPADTQPDALQQNATKQRISYDHTSSVTDICDSSNNHPSSPPSLQISNKQNQFAETTFSSGEKEPIITAKGSVLNFTVKASNTRSPSSCASHDFLATNCNLSNHIEQPCLSSLGDTVNAADSRTAPAVLSLEGDPPNAEPTRQGQTGILLFEGDPYLQHDHPGKSQSRLHGRGIDQRDNSADSCDTENRGCSCPPCLTPTDASSRTHKHTLTRSATADGASPLEHNPELLEVPSPTKEEHSNQPSMSPKQRPSTSTPNIPSEPLDPAIFVDVVHPQSAFEQQQQAENRGDKTTKWQQSDLSADPASSLNLASPTASRQAVEYREMARDYDSGAISSTAEAPPLETLSITLSEAKETEFDKTQLIDQDESTEMRRQLKPSAKADSAYEAAITSTTRNTVTHNPSAVASITDVPQPIRAKSAQETTLAELKAKRAALIASLGTLPVIRNIIADAENSSARPRDVEPTDSEIMAATQQISKRHIKLLHEYNEIKDVAQGLMGLIADQRGVRIVEVQEDFGVDTKD